MAEDKGQTGIAFLDMTDVLRFLRENTAVSGIQRVVVEVAPRLTKAMPCQYVSYAPDRGSYVRLSTASVESLMDAVAHASDDTESRVNDQAAALLNELARAPVLRAADGDVLGILGSAWGLPGLFQDVQRLKAEGASVVVLLFDLIPVLMPGFPEGVVHEFRHYIPRVAQLADRAPGISDSTRRDFERYCEARDWEIPPGATTTLAADQWDPKRLQRLNLPPAPAWPRPYALFVSTIEVRKNHILALRCWRRLIEQFGAEAVPDLVFVGRLGWSVLEFLEEFESTEGLNGKIHILRSVPEAQLAALYRDCAFTIYPSLYEGWGLPVAESLQWGKPVVSARNSSLEEVGLDFARYFDNDDVMSMAEAVSVYVRDPDQLRRDGDRIGEQYVPPTWDTVAQVFVAEFAAARVTRRPIPLRTEVGLEYGVLPLRPFAGPPTGEHIARFVEHERRLPLTGQTTSWDRSLAAELMVSTRNGRTRITVSRPEGGECFLVCCTPEGFGKVDLLIRGPQGDRLERIPRGGALLVELGSGAAGAAASVEVADVKSKHPGPSIRSFVLVPRREEAAQLVRERHERLAGERGHKVKQRVASTTPGRAAVAGMRRVRARSS